MTTDPSLRAAPRQSDRRPAWRKALEFPLVTLVLAAALVLLVLTVVQLLLERVAAPLSGTTTGLVIGTLASVFAVFAVYKLAIRRFGAHKRDDLPLSQALPDLGLGLLVGGALITTVVGLAALFGVYRVAGWSSGANWAWHLLSAGLVAGFVEEVLLRGIVFRWLEEFAGSWIALALSALLFGFLHASNPNATVFSSLAIAVEAGVLLGAAYMLTRNLWLAIGLHAGWNVFQGLVWSVPVSGFAQPGLLDAELYPPAWLSGGAFGLEASAIALVVATGAGAWMLRAAAREGRVVRPLWRRSDALAGGVRQAEPAPSVPRSPD